MLARLLVLSGADEANKDLEILCGEIVE